MEFTIVKRQIILQYLSLYESAREKDEWSLEACIDVFRYYYKLYEKVFRREHPNLTNETIKGIIENFPYCSDDNMISYDITLSPDDYPQMIRAYFQQDFEGCNYSIAHFMSGNIRALRYYEGIY